jgi:hypothetical protein
MPPTQSAPSFPWASPRRRTDSTAAGCAPSRRQRDTLGRFAPPLE